jgi:ACS family tartrate transporter-like MFS transporter
MSEDRVFTKCAWRLIPFMVLLYVVNYLDRVNVGFAALTMNRDLGFSPPVYGFGAGIFFIGYTLFQVPANIILERIGVRRWVFCILLVWGAVSAGCAFVKGSTSFYVLRFLLGIAEAGFYPGMLLYLTYWFPQNYRARFMAVFQTSVLWAFIIGGPVSGLILQTDGMSGLRGWQWLFLIQGVPACLLAFAVLKLLPDGPAAAPWLALEEKRMIATALGAEDSREHAGIIAALRDPRVLALSLVLLGNATALYGFDLWLPQIVQGMGFSTLATGFLVVIPYVGGIAAMLVWATHSDRTKERIWHIALPAFLTASGFLAASFAQSPLVVLFALTLVRIGISSLLAPFWSLSSAVLGRRAAAGGIAFINTVGSGLGGFTGPVAIGFLKQQTGGYAASMAALGCVMVFALGRKLSRRPKVAVSPSVADRA